MKSPNYKILCNITHFEKVFKDFENLLADMNDDSSIRQLFNKQIITLNNIVQKYDVKKNIKVYIQDINKAYQQAQQTIELQDSMAFEENVFGVKNEIFVKSYPVWYRAELNYVINRLNVMIDSLSIKNKQCIKPTKLKMIQPKHIDFTEKQEEEFYDALESLP